MEYLPTSGVALVAHPSTASANRYSSFRGVAAGLHSDRQPGAALACSQRRGDGGCIALPKPAVLAAAGAELKRGVVVADGLWAEGDTTRVDIGLAIRLAAGEADWAANCGDCPCSCCQARFCSAPADS